MFWRVQGIYWMKEAGIRFHWIAGLNSSIHESALYGGSSRGDAKKWYAGVF